MHARGGEAYQVGLGFYAFLRFHIDSRKFRKWGLAGTPDATACAPLTTTIAQSPTPAAPAAPAAQSPAPEDPLSPIPN
jgi:hypothetical protein